MILGYIIEHPTRGVFLEWNWDHHTQPDMKKPKFAWAINRNDAKVHSFATLNQAKENLMEMPLNIRAKCYVMEYQWTNGKHHNYKKVYEYAPDPGPEFRRPHKGGSRKVPR